ncbi:MAG TPA: glycosyltransferase family 2 protein [Bacilli bacterium]
MEMTSIIIANYNGGAWLKDCIYAIRQHTFSPYELIVVDNGSNDNTLDYCLQEDVILISLSENEGFPKACNRGLRLARGNAILLLNNDVLVAEGWLSGMLSCLYSHTDIGIVGPVTNYASGKQQIDIPYTNLREMAEHFSRLKQGNWQQVERLVGFCYLFKRELLNQIGLLDERFSPGHYEDDDYCYRARQAGYRLFMACDVFVYHHGSYSFNKENEEKVKELIALNHQKFIDKWGVDPHIFI